MMRTTVRIEEDLLCKLKQQAHREGTSLTKVMNRVLLAGLDTIHRSTNKVRPFRQQTHDMGVPRVDLTKALALAASMEDEEIIKKMSLGK